MAFDRRETAILLIGDFFILAASLWIALLLRNLAVPSPGYFNANLVPFLPIFLLSLFVFYSAGLYEKQTRPNRSVMSMRIFGAQAATVAIAAILFFALPLSIAPKTILVLYLGVSVIAESIWRFYRMTREIEAGKRIPALLIGSGHAVLELYDEVNGNSRYLLRFLGHLETRGLVKESVYKSVVFGIKDGIRIFVIDMFDPHVVRDIPKLYDLMTDKIIFLGFASFYEEIFDRVPIEHIDAVQLLDSLPMHRTLYDGCKRLFDIALAAVGSLIAIPFVGIAALLLSANGGMPFIWNERIGKGGRTFRIVKLRSMLLNDNGDPELQKKNRVTALGRLLRRTRIDELPQLWNVLTGDLSFIGPRPELPKIAEVYDREIPLYRMRHLVAPGLSGWAQIHDYDAPRGPADVARTRRKLSFDLYYLKHRSFGLDLAIAIKTLRTLFAFSGT
ncbi:MAG TPA: sugar transferase [Candidatus Paceibacterota bacterium]|nr:sugar transferase [Candidatus Paceibacterota bacterium]